MMLLFFLQGHSALLPVVITSGDSSSDEDGTSVVSVVMESTASPLATVTLFWAGGKDLHNGWRGSLKGCIANIHLKLP